MQDLKPPEASGGPLGPDQISEQLYDMFLAAYADERGIHVETMLAGLGAMAGFGCQMAVREAIRLGDLEPTGALVVVETKDGGTYYFGDQLNQPLLEAPISVWKLVAGAAEQAGATVAPDIMDIVRNVSATVGGDKFGEVRVEWKHQPHVSPLDALKRFWRDAYAFVQQSGGDPMMTGWLFAGAAQRLIIRAKDAIDPFLACFIVMEAAVAMSKIDPKVIGFDPDRPAAEQ